MRFGYLCYFWCILHLCWGSQVTENNPSRKHENPECATLICEQAHQQAKGLSKLALLDEFVSQTVLLLKDLMKNIDGELEKSANSLLRYIHPHCHSTRQILEEVIEMQKAKPVQASPSLGGNINPLSKDTEESYDNGSDYEGQEQNGGARVDWSPAQVSDSREDDGLGAGDDTAAGGQERPGAWLPRKDPQSSSSSTASRGNSKFGRGWGHKTGRGEHEEKGWASGDLNPYNYDKEGKSLEGPGIITTGYGKDSEASTSNTKLSTSQWKGLQKPPEGYKSSTTCKGQGCNCRGVSKDSAFWVQGLDEWCIENCSKGYCPKTHCIC